VQQLPTENNGALIFRNGFEDATRLFCKTPLQANVVSKYVGNYSFFQGVNEQVWTNDLPGNESSDAIFDYSNSSLTVYR
jgi:hypothetical protein